jgi:hypothetical protein
MLVVRYYRDGRHWDTERIERPQWPDVEAAIRRMDDYCFPIVHLNTTGEDWGEEVFNVIGGAGRWALFHMMGEWQYEDAAGSDEDVRLWENDQGYFCKEKNVHRRREGLTDSEVLLRDWLV